MRLKPQTYAVTISTHQQHRHFQRTANAELFIATLLRYRDAGKFLLHGFVVMPDHVHVLITPSESTAKAIQLIKGATPMPRASNQPAKSGTRATTNIAFATLPTFKPKNITSPTTQSAKATRTILTSTLPTPLPSTLRCIS